MKPWISGLLLCGLSALTACDEPKELVVPPAPDDDDGAAVKPVTLPEPLDLTGEGAAARSVTLRTGDPARWGSCQLLLERGGRPAKRYPYQDQPGQEFEALTGCGILAREVTEDGRRFLIYDLRPTIPGERSKNINLVAYDAQGALRWAHRLARSEKSGASFIASHRGTFIAQVEPLLLCAGSLWESGVDVECVREASGAVAWSGRLSFWSGIAPVGAHKSLFVTDLSGLRQIYPWNGVERRFERLNGPGGRSSLYASDGRALYFSSSRGAPTTLGAWELETMKPRWVRELPFRLESGVKAVSREHGLLIARHESELLGIDTADGAVRWRVGVGEHMPKIAFGREVVLVLVRREGAANLLFGLDPETGEARWWATPPTGTLQMSAEGGHVVFMSARTTWRAPLPEAEGGP